MEALGVGRVGDDRVEALADRPRDGPDRERSVVDAFEALHVAGRRGEEDLVGAVDVLELQTLLDHGDPELGWLAKTGRLALGYLGDPEKTSRTYPVVDGIRYAVPGDRARLLAAGVVELHGRDSATINSGGEKIFAEEVEAALKSHPGVYDCLVAGRPSERWGDEVVAINDEFVADDCEATALVRAAEGEVTITTRRAK